MSEILAKLIVKAPTMYETKTTSMSKTKQRQPLAQDLFCPEKTKFRSEVIKPLYKDETWTVDLINESSFSKYINNFKYIKIVIEILSKYALARSLGSINMV